MGVISGARGNSMEEPQQKSAKIAGFGGSGGVAEESRDCVFASAAGTGGPLWASGAFEWSDRYSIQVE